jgi:hypothetical protein
MKTLGVRCPLVLAVVTVLAGCGTASMHYLNDGAIKYPPTSVDKVSIFSERTIPGKTYIEMGYVSVHVTTANTGDELKQAIRKEAASIGADAVVDFRIFAGGVGAKYAFFDYRTYGLGAGAIAIKYEARTETAPSSYGAVPNPRSATPGP